MVMVVHLPFGFCVAVLCDQISNSTRRARAHEGELLCGHDLAVRLVVVPLQEHAAAVLDLDLAQVVEPLALEEQDGVVHEHGRGQDEHAVALADAVAHHAVVGRGEVKDLLRDDALDAAGLHGQDAAVDVAGPAASRTGHGAHEAAQGVDPTRPWARRAQRASLRRARGGGAARTGSGVGTPSALPSKSAMNSEVFPRTFRMRVACVSAMMRVPASTSTRNFSDTPLSWPAACGSSRRAGAPA